jgi:hypothetical protein
MFLLKSLPSYGKGKYTYRQTDFILIRHGLHRKRRFLQFYFYIPGLTNTRTNKRIDGRVVFCAVHIVSNESTRLVLPRTSYFISYGVLVWTFICVCVHIYISRQKWETYAAAFTYPHLSHKVLNSSNAILSNARHSLGILTHALEGDLLYTVITIEALILLNNSTRILCERHIVW